MNPKGPREARKKGIDVRFEKFAKFRYTKGEVQAFLGVDRGIMRRAWKAVGVGSTSYCAGRSEDFDPDLVYGVPMAKVVEVMRWVYLNAARQLERRGRLR